MSSAVRTKYWRPGDDYRKIIHQSLRAHLQDGDIVAISEKALAVAQDQLVDEAPAHTGVIARILTFFWMRLVWGHVLGRLCHLTSANMRRLRGYPPLGGGRHKQVCLEQVGFLQALRPFSEGGIDTSNLPYSLASLPLKSPTLVAEDIRQNIADMLGKKVSVVIVDSDKTYSWRGIHFSSRDTEISGIVRLGLLAYLMGRTLRWRARSTPLAWVGSGITPEFALRVAGLANKVRGFGAGRTAWEMAARFGVSVTDVDWRMLEQIEHKPIVILRPEQDGALGRPKAYTRQESALTAQTL